MRSFKMAGKPDAGTELYTGWHGQPHGIIWEQRGDRCAERFVSLSSVCWRSDRVRAGGFRYRYLPRGLLDAAQGKIMGL